MLNRKESFPHCVHIKIRFAYKFIAAVTRNILYSFPCLCNQKISRQTNVCVVRLPPFTYVIFYGNNGYAAVNATGIRSFDSIVVCYETFKKYLNMLGVYNSCITNPIIDNMTYTGCINMSSRNLDLFSLYQHAVIDRSDFNAHLNPLHLNNLVLQDKEKRGTYLLYKSGRYSLVGVKKQSDVECLHSKLIALIQVSLL